MRMRATRTSRAVGVDVRCPARAGDDGGHQLGHAPHDVGVLRSGPNQTHGPSLRSRRDTGAGSDSIAGAPTSRGRAASPPTAGASRYRRADPIAARPSLRAAAAPSTRSTGRRCRARRRPRRRRRASAPHRSRRPPRAPTWRRARGAGARPGFGPGCSRARPRSSSPGDGKHVPFLAARRCDPLPDCAAWPTQGWTSSNSPTSSSPARPRSGRITRSPPGKQLASTAPGRIRRRVRQLLGGRHRRRVRCDGPRAACSMPGKVHETVRSWSPRRLDTVIFTHGSHRPRVRRRLGDEEEAAAQTDGIRRRSSRTTLDAASFAWTWFTAGYNAVINQRRFRAPTSRWPTNYRYPTRPAPPPRSRRRQRAFELLHDAP